MPSNPAPSSQSPDELANESANEPVNEVSGDLPANGATDAKRGLISRVLPSAIALWLKSQVEHVENLQIRIEGRDRQILTGHVPGVQLSARKAIYQGIHVSHIQLAATGIRVNLRQILRGKPLTLLEVIPVQGELTVTEADLNASLLSPLLKDAVTEFLVGLLQSGHAVEELDDSAEQIELQDLQVMIGDQQLTLGAQLVSASGSTTPIAIRTGLAIREGSILQLIQPIWLPHLRAKRGLPLDDLDGHEIPLGTDVNLHTLSLASQQLLCQGQINVIPA